MFGAVGHGEREDGGSQHHRQRGPTHDRVFTDEFKLTHEFLGMMLGASRPHVTLVARKLQRAGLIAYCRGRVTVRDRRKLEAASCECYRVVRQYFNEFLRRLAT